MSDWTDPPKTKEPVWLPVLVAVLVVAILLFILNGKW